MVYIIKKKIGNNNFDYLVKNIRVGDSWKKITLYLGKAKNSQDIFKKFNENIEYFTNKELEIKSCVLPNFKLVPNDLLIKTEKLFLFTYNKIYAKKIDYISDFAKEFIFESNKIEGSRIPKEEVKNIYENNKTNHKNLQEIKEVENSKLAMEYLTSKFSMNITSIKSLYYKLTKDLIMESGNPYFKGFKKFTNVVGNSKTTSPENVEKELNELIEWYKKNKKENHPLELAFEFHLRFESIHPFQDGNGRVGRMIMNKILIDFGYLPIIIYQENRKSYFNAILKGREGARQKYNTFMIKQAKKTLDKFYILTFFTN